MKLFLLIIFAFVTVDVFGQEDSVNIYVQALGFYNSHLDRIKSSQTEIYIEESLGITESFPPKIGNRKVTVLGWDNKKAVYSRNNNRLTLVQVFPAKTNGDKLEINFTPYGARRKGNRYYQAVSDWVIIQFYFDTTESRIKYFATKTGGI